MAQVGLREFAMKIGVTGATGFLGGAAARRLATLGHEVSGVGRNRNRGAMLQRDGVRFTAADLSEGADAEAFCRGLDVVVHCAAMSEPWGRYEDFHRNNVQVTEQVVAGCRRHGVARLVHISTPAVYANGCDRTNVREDDPLPSLSSMSFYVRTKRLAEQTVARASTAGLDAVVLRPRGLYGPGDTTILPRIVAALRERRLPRIGPGTSLADLTYIDNAVLAIERALNAPDARGGTYNISDGDPQRLWGLIDYLAFLMGLPVARRRLPYGLAYQIGWASEVAYRALRIQSEPRLTRYTAMLLGRTMTLDISAARRDLGYAPNIATREGVRRYVSAVRRHEGAE